MSKQLPQRAYAAVSGAMYDKCYTPPHAVEPLLSYLLPPFMHSGAPIWECAVGAGWLKQWLERAGYTVDGTDIETGQDFLTTPPPRHSIIVTNPPFSLKYRFIERACEIGSPFAFLVPFSTLAAQKVLDIQKRYNVEFQELRLSNRVNFYMPGTGYENNGAQMAVLWLCHNLLPERIVHAKLPPAPENHRIIKPKKPSPVEKAIKTLTATVQELRLHRYTDDEIKNIMLSTIKNNTQ